MPRSVRKPNVRIGVEKAWWISTREISWDREEIRCRGAIQTPPRRRNGELSLAKRLHLPCRHHANERCLARDGALASGTSGATRSTAMRDQDLKQHVQIALDWEPSLEALDIGVSVDHGIVTLRGNVSSCAERATAERVALRVVGVKAVANDLGVRLTRAFRRTDTEVAQAAAEALKCSIQVPDDRLTVIVREGWLTLNGTVHWRYQKYAAARAVGDLSGVTGVTNDIVVKWSVKSIDVWIEI
jgi:osmotically-inducible protein OsmY